VYSSYGRSDYHNNIVNQSCIYVAHSHKYEQIVQLFSAASALAEQIVDAGERYLGALKELHSYIIWVNYIVFRKKIP